MSSSFSPPSESIWTTTSIHRITGFFGLFPSSVITENRKHDVSEAGSRRQVLLENSKLAQHAYEEGHRVGWDGARILKTESNSRYRKHKESAQLACLTDPISEPSLDISPI
jgi:hypothetical protein